MAVKNKSHQKTSSFSLMGVIFSILFISSFYYSKQFTDLFIVPKHYFTVFSALIPVLLILVYYFFQKQAKPYTINRIDLSLLVFFIYITVQQLVFSINPLSNLRYLDLLIVVFIYFLFKPAFDVGSKLNENDKFIRTVFTALILVGFFQAMYGILQYAGKIENLQKEFRLGGAFGNPGPYANYITALIPVAFTFIVFGKKGTLRTLAVFSFLVMLIVLPVTAARTAWISAFISISYILLNYNKISIWRKKYLSSSKHLIILGLSVLVIAFVAIWFLKDFKQESASGRVFIWKVSADIVIDKPVTGYGFGSYAVVHNNYQADYFRNNPGDTENAYRADGINYAFNEYIQFACEIGIVGLILFLTIFYFAFFRKKKDNQPDDKYNLASEGIILSILISSLFSYPLQSLPVLIILIFALMILSDRRTTSLFRISSNLLVKRLIILVVLFLAGLFITMESKRFKSEKKWLVAFQSVREHKYDQAKDMYKGLYPVMKYSPFFLFNYGAEFSVMGDYNKSIEIFKEAVPRINDADYWIYLGNSYEGIGNYPKAVECYLQASYIMPIKFYPKYRLVLLYNKLGNIEEALRYAREITNKKVKVPSNIVQSISEEMENYVLQHEGTGK